MKKNGLAVEIEDERGARYPRATGEQFVKLLTSLGGRWNTWLIANRIPAGNDDYFQVLREAESAYRVEVRAGSAEAHVATVMESASDVERSFVLWAEGGAGRGDDRDAAIGSHADADAWRLGRAWTHFSDLDSDVAPDPLIAEEASANARRLIESGYLSLREVADAVIDLQEDFGGDDQPERLVFPQAKRLAEVVWRERLAEQASWPERTDLDALESAFAGLESRGVVARPNFACCSSCARAEIGAELDDDSRGYVFFHYQSTERAVKSGDLYLHYGACEPHDLADVAREIVGRLEDEGLPVVWNGETDTAIKVAPIVWQKRIAELTDAA